MDSLRGESHAFKIMFMNMLLHSGIALISLKWRFLSIRYTSLAMALTVPVGASGGVKVGATPESMTEMYLLRWGHCEMSIAIWAVQRGMDSTSLWMICLFASCKIAWGKDVPTGAC